MIEKKTKIKEQLKECIIIYKEVWSEWKTERKIVVVGGIEQNRKFANERVNRKNCQDLTKLEENEKFIREERVKAKTKGRCLVKKKKKKKIISEKERQKMEKIKKKKNLIPEC